MCSPENPLIQIIVFYFKQEVPDVVREADELSFLSKGLTDEHSRGLKSGK